MTKEANNHNNIFRYALFGALLFIAAMGFILFNLPSIITFDLSATIVAGMLAVAAMSLLYKAIKSDRERLQL